MQLINFNNALCIASLAATTSAMAQSAIVLSCELNYPNPSGTARHEISINETEKTLRFEDTVYTLTPVEYNSFRDGKKITHIRSIDYWGDYSISWGFDFLIDGQKLKNDKRAQYRLDRVTGEFRHIELNASGSCKKGKMERKF